MAKKVLVLSASPRKGGNSDLLCDQFMLGATEAGNQVEKVFLRDKRIDHCIACGACQSNGGKCVQKDDMAESEHANRGGFVLANRGTVAVFDLKIIDSAGAATEFLQNTKIQPPPQVLLALLLHELSCLLLAVTDILPR